MNNTHLETFIRIVEAGSFNKAAEELYITSTAIIKQINLLENEVGVPLFERTHRGLRLTSAGESFYTDAKYVEWDHSIPFGVLYATEPSDTVKRFLDAVKTVI